MNLDVVDEARRAWACFLVVGTENKGISRLLRRTLAFHMRLSIINVWRSRYGNPINLAHSTQKDATCFAKSRSLCVKFIEPCAGIRDDRCLSSGEDIVALGLDVE